MRACRTHSLDDILDRPRGTSSDKPPSAGLPVVKYTRSEQTRVAGEVVALPDVAVIAEWLADYAVLREQARACEP